MIVIARLEALAAFSATARVRLTISRDAAEAIESLDILGDQLQAVVEQLRADARAPLAGMVDPGPVLPDGPL